MLNLQTNYQPKGDQARAILELVNGLKSDKKAQTLLGVTGSGKTFTIANVLSQVKRPAIVISHNKTLAAQLYQEFKEFFPKSEVHYFVSYYDYYQPEAYLPQSDTYIGKDAKINDFIDQLRHSALQAVLTSPDDFIVVASVSCIYGIGNPAEYERMGLRLRVGEKRKREEILKNLSLLQYERDAKKEAGTFKVRGELVEIILPDGETKISLELFGNSIESISGQKSGFPKEDISEVKIYPAKFFVTEKAKLSLALANIRRELEERVKDLKRLGKKLEAERLIERTNFDLEVLSETGYVAGIENYSRHLSFRSQGEPPYTLLDYLPKNTLFIIDESHMTVPQLNGMYFGDQSRKQMLVDYGFRLPSALDNRPLKFKEFEEKMAQTSAIFVSATPGLYEIQRGNVVEQLVRPTGLLDPAIEVRPAANQVEDALKEIEKAVKAGERVFLLTLTKRMAEDLSLYLREKEIRAEYLHSDVKTMERTKTLYALRKGEYDVLVGINLLREGLDLPEVALILILDADKEGYLRNYTSLIQTIGRASRHINGRAILYADEITGSIKKTIRETNRRREIQIAFNKKHGITPKPVIKPIYKPFWIEKTKPKEEEFEKLLKGLQEKIKNPAEIKIKLEEIMLEAADNLEFEKAAKLRDLIKSI